MRDEATAVCRRNAWATWTARRVFDERYDKGIAVEAWRRLLADVAREPGQRGRDAKSA
mgnify:CR=1 FL=1